MDRRRFLASAASVTIAAAGGCTGCAAAPTASLSMESVTDTGIAERVTSGIEADEDNDRYVLVRETVGSGAATRNGSRPPMPEGSPFVYDGGVYELRYRVLESTPATRFTVTLNPVDDDPAPGAVVDYGDLPAVDRETFEERGWDGEFLGFVTSVLYLDGEIPESVLVPEPARSVIRWPDGTLGRFTVDGSADTALRTYRYTAETLHESAAELGRNLCRRRAFTLAGLSEAEREIVETAVRNREPYVVPPDEEPSAAMRRLADRFRGREAVEHLSERDDGSTEDDARSASGSYLVRYQAAVYWTELRIEPSTATPEGSGRVADR